MQSSVVAVRSAVLRGSWALALALLILPLEAAPAGETGSLPRHDAESGSVPGGGEAGAPAAPFPGPEALPLLLYGVVIVEPGDSLAFIHDGNSRSQVRKVRAGQNFAGALVKAIHPDRITLEFSGVAIDLPLWSEKGGLPAAGQIAGDQPYPPESPRPPTSSELSKPLVHRQWRYPEAVAAPRAPEGAGDPADGQTDSQP